MGSCVVTAGAAVPDAEKEPTADDDSSSGDDVLTLGFTDEDLDEDDSARLTKMAEKHEYDESKYASWTDLAADLGEFLELSGTIETIKEFFEQADPEE